MRKTLIWLGAALLIVIIFLCAVNPNAFPAWTGFGDYKIDKTISRHKTLWDWLDLLLVPIILAGGAWFLSKSESDLDRKREKDRFDHDNLSKYLEFMMKLIIENKMSNLAEQSLARTQSLSIIKNTSGEKKGQVLQFLYESGLIYAKPFVDLNGADFTNGELDRITLRGAELRGIYFSNCSLKKANLEKAIFKGSNFSNSDISNSMVDGTDFFYADFTNTTMKNVDLRKANIHQADFSGADLEGTIVSLVQANEIKKYKFKVKPTIK